MESAKTMMRCRYLFALIPALFCVGVADAQDNPLMEKIAANVIQKYQQSSCEDLKAQKTAPPSDMQKKAVEQLHNNPDMRKKFIDLVAGPIANRLFECGMVP